MPNFNAWTPDPWTQSGVMKKLRSNTSIYYQFFLKTLGIKFVHKSYIIC